MRFSSRTQWNTDESELAVALKARRAAGLPVFDLTNANPTRYGFDYPSDLLAPLANPRSFDYDPDPKGLLSAREAVATYYRDHGADLAPNNVVLTTSTSEAYSFLFRLLCDTGAEILVPQPSYPLFDFLADLDDVCLVSAPLIYDHGWQIDAEGFRQAITEKTRAIVLVHPNNPTGHFTRSWEVTELAKLCREHGLALIVDEVFLDFPLEHGIEAATFARGVEGVNCFIVSGLSKICGLPQMKAAWIAVIGPDAAESLARLEVIADTFLSMNAPIQAAIPVWLANRRQIQSQIHARLMQNLAELDRQLAEQSLLNRLEIMGGWYAILRVPALDADEVTALRLLEKGVHIHPGAFFGMKSSGWLVVSLLATPDEFAGGLKQIVNHFSTNQKS